MWHDWYCVRTIRLAWYWNNVIPGHWFTKSCVQRYKRRCVMHSFFASKKQTNQQQQQIKQKTWNRMDTMQRLKRTRFSSFLVGCNVINIIWRKTRMAQKIRMLCFVLISSVLLNFNSFFLMCLDFVLERLQSFLFQISVLALIFSSFSTPCHGSGMQKTAGHSAKKVLVANVKQNGSRALVQNQHTRELICV